MSRQKWSPLRRHFVRYMLHYMILVFIIVLIVGIILSVFLVGRAVRVKAEGPTVFLKQDKNFPVGRLDYQREANLILPLCQIPSINLTVYLPNSYRNIAGIAYHEAANDNAISLVPIGHLLKNDNAYRVDASLDSKEALPTYVIMESRGENQAATTVADVAIKDGAHVLSPISGVVTRIEPKTIYSGYDDTQVEIMPDGHEDIRVTFLHLKDLRVSTGTVVKQGKSILGTPIDYREHFSSEIDDYVKPPSPHVHIQVDRYVAR